MHLLESRFVPLLVIQLDATIGIRPIGSLALGRSLNSLISLFAWHLGPFASNWGNESCREWELNNFVFA